MYDAVIIGAGVIGSAIAYQLRKYKLNVLLIDKDNDVSNGTSKANSAIIHAGYDPETGTKMARFNVEGSVLTKQICEELNVPYSPCGAMVLAFNEKDEEEINRLYKRGNRNGVSGLQLLSKEEVLLREPNLSAEVTGALWAPTSAIISPWEYTLAMAENAVANGCELALNNEVKSISKENGIFTVETDKNSYQSRYVINCAGLYADKINEMINGKSFEINSVKGEYYLLDKTQGSQVSCTIFQCPNVNGKGVLVSPTVHGNLIVGPNTQNNEKDDLSTSAEGLAFVKKQSVLSVPGISFGDNIRNFAGNRAKTSYTSDFIVEESETENFYNCAAICSPGLSSASAIGLEVVRWIQSKEELKEKENVKTVKRPTPFKELSIEEKNEIIRENPAYGRIICRCEQVSEGEILAALNEVIPAETMDGVKRRVRAGMGRCQSSFCGPKVAEILARERNIDVTEVYLDHNGSNIAVEKTKEVR